MSSLKVSKPMLWLLVAAVSLTVISYGVRQWRESSAMQTVIEGAVPAYPQEGASELPPRVALSPELLRPAWPKASIDAMPNRQPAAVPAAVPEPGAQQPSPIATALPPPSFRLVGRFVDGKVQRVFLVQGDELIAAKVGQKLPDGYVLKALRGEKITLLRSADGEKFELTLEAP